MSDYDNEFDMDYLSECITNFIKNSDHNGLDNFLKNKSKKVIDEYICYDKTNYYPDIIHACVDNKYECISILMKYGFDIHSSSGDDESPYYNSNGLSILIEKNYFSTIEKLFYNYNINVYEQDCNIDDYLILATNENNFKIVSFLIDYYEKKKNEGTDKIKNKVLNTYKKCIKIAEKKNYKDVFTLIQEYIDNKANSSNIKSVYFAYKSNKLDLLKNYTEYSCEELSKIKDDEGNNIIHLVCQYSNVPLLKMFIKNEINFDEKNNNGLTPFLLACKLNSSIEFIKLLKKKSDIKVCDNKGNNCLMYIAKNGNKELYELFIKKINMKKFINKRGKDIIHKIVKGKNLEILKMVTFPKTQTIDMEGRTAQIFLDKNTEMYAYYISQIRK